MYAIPATRYVRLTDVGAGVLLEGGKPLIVQGMVMSAIADNGEVVLTERDGTTEILRAYVDTNFGANPTTEYVAPFLADKGIMVFGVSVFGSPGIDPISLDVTIFYSHVGA